MERFTVIKIMQQIKMQKLTFKSVAVDLVTSPQHEIRGGKVKLQLNPRESC